ncbi:MAG: metalloregulator ArsR/SmtB family transcription factor [Hyphomicrobiales bacterium]|nr:metalloregulator ArsR/SmtB family transcription factor [Hyphomicrobiales bacterium]
MGKLLVGDLPFEAALPVLRTAGEETRLRILALLGEGELTVSDLTEILGQSQPRISRHLKVMVEAGLLLRYREGSWVFYRLAEGTKEAAFLRRIIASLDRDDPVIGADRERFATVRKQRSAAAQAFFAKLAPQWDLMRSLHVPEHAVEAAISEVIGEKELRSVLDLGTGTGQILKLVAPLAARAVGVDASHAMLSVARANMQAAGLMNVDLRQGDIYALSLPRDAFDLVVIHQVLHYLDDPQRAVAEAARLVAPSGRLLVVDFAAHQMEQLRESSGHRRLGFTHEQIAGWMRAAGLETASVRDLAPPDGDPGKLTVTLWLGRDLRVVNDAPPALMHVA